MSKRPALGLDAVVRPSRLATKGAARPADEGATAPTPAPAITAPPPPRPPRARRLAEAEGSPAGATDAPRLDETTAVGPDEAWPAELPPLALAPAADAPPAPDLVADLLARLDDKDRELERLRSERHQLESALAASDASIDDLRNLVADLRLQRDRQYAEILQLSQQHAAERQRLIDDLLTEREQLLDLNEKLLALEKEARQPGPAAASSAAPASSSPSSFGSWLRRLSRGAASQSSEPPPKRGQPRTLNRRPLP